VRARRAPPNVDRPRARRLADSGIRSLGRRVMRFNQRARCPPGGPPTTPTPSGPGSHHARLCWRVRPRAMSAFSKRRLVQAAIPLQLCLPRRADTPPTGDGWIHEIKHDGFRVLVRRDKEGVRLFTRNGYDFTARFPKIAAAVENLGVGSCVLDGEAVVVDERGLAVFDVLRYRLFAIMPPSCAPSTSLS
jgi:hypothetical protein